MASVEVVTRSESSGELRVHETLRGTLPDIVEPYWFGTQYGPFPEVGPTRYLASFEHIEMDPATGRARGTILDLRVDDEAARAEVTAALALPPVVDVAALDSFAETYADSWVFHRAPRVVATRVSGIAQECCTGAGGTFVVHDVTEDLRGDAERDVLVRGGHAYYSEETCGDERILGAGPLVPSDAEDVADCDGQGAVDTTAAATAIFVERAGSAAAREEVRGWLAAAPPLYRIGPPDAAVVPATAADAPPWSTVVGFEEALTTGLVEIRIVDARTTDAGHEVLFETKLRSDWPEREETFRAKIAFACGDPRLTEVGARWLVPITGGDGFAISEVADAIDARALFIVPGVVLPVTELNGELPGESVPAATRAALAQQLQGRDDLVEGRELLLRRAGRGRERDQRFDLAEHGDVEGLQDWLSVLAHRLVADLRRLRAVRLRAVRDVELRVGVELLEALLRDGHALFERGRGLELLHGDDDVGAEAAGARREADLRPLGRRDERVHRAVFPVVGNVEFDQT